MTLHNLIKFAVDGEMQLQLFFTPTDSMSANLLTKLQLGKSICQFTVFMLLSPLMWSQLFSINTPVVDEQQYIKLPPRICDQAVVLKLNKCYYYIWVEKF